VPDEDHLQDLIGNPTLDEKVRLLLTGATAFTLRAVPKSR
jgi:hypothetical protein